MGQYGHEHLFAPGQKVRCSQPVRSQRDRYGNTWPTQGRIYTVREIIVDGASGVMGLHLAEILNPERQCYPGGRLGEVAFSVLLFTRA